MFGECIMELTSATHIEFVYLWQPPKKYTFQQEDLKLFVKRYCQGKVLNLFAGKTILDVDEIRVDINPEMPADYHMDAFEFINSWNGSKFDTVILDPPYNVRKSREKYSVGIHDYHIGKLTQIKNRLVSITNLKGIVISLGYDSVGMSRLRGFNKVAICLVCHGGDHNDTICLVEKKTSEQLKLWN